MRRNKMYLPLNVTFDCDDVNVHMQGIVPIFNDFLVRDKDPPSYTFYGPADDNVLEVPQVQIFVFVV